jgi:hypothetical protein
VEEEEGEGSNSISVRQPDKAMEEAEEGGGAPHKQEREEVRRGSSCRVEREEEGEEGQGGSRRSQEKGEKQGGSRCNEEKEEEGEASWRQDTTGKGTEDSEDSWRWNRDGWPPEEAGLSGPPHPASSRRPSLPPFLPGSWRREETLIVGIAGRHDGRSVEGLVAAWGQGSTMARLQTMRLDQTNTTTSLISFAHLKGSWTAVGRG